CCSVLENVESSGRQTLWSLIVPCRLTIASANAGCGAHGRDMRLTKSSTARGGPR
ncbi:hypothetical protein L210DRAFT_3568051, partial [Boletus edulis BED1]